MSYTRIILQAICWLKLCKENEIVFVMLQSQGEYVVWMELVARNISLEMGKLAQAFVVPMRSDTTTILRNAALFGTEITSSSSTSFFSSLSITD